MSRIADSSSTAFVERRKGGDRRRNSDRRSYTERRHDFRDGDPPAKMGLRGWLRSKIRSRLGVDRRKEDRRCPIDRRQQHPQSILSREELSDLLSG